MLEVDLLLVPVHVGNHWTCACVDLARRELRYYDSFQVNFFLYAPFPLNPCCFAPARCAYPISLNTAKAWQAHHLCYYTQLACWTAAVSQINGVAGLLQGKEQWVMEALRRYVADEARNKQDAELDTSDWPVECAAAA